MRLDIFRRLAIATFAVIATAFSSARAQQLNPNTNIKWSQTSGSGAPTASCSSANYGQPYQDISVNPSKHYKCGTGGWEQDTVLDSSGALRVQDIVSAGGPFTDVRSYGAKCDGTTDDATALQNAINAWMLKGGVLYAAPQGATCIFKAPLTANFTATSVPPKIIDWRGGEWLGELQSPGLVDFKLYETGAGVIEVENIRFLNGYLEDIGGTNAASHVLELNGGGGAYHFLDRITSDAFHVVANATATVPTIGIYMQAIFQSHFYNTTVDNSLYDGTHSLAGAYDWYIAKETSGDQATGEIELNNSEGIGGDVGVYDASAGHNRVIGGTYIQTQEEAFYGYSVAGEVLDRAHFEATWFNNGSAPSPRPDYICNGICDLKQITDYSSGTSGSGFRDSLARVYNAGAGGEAILEYNQGCCNSPKQAVVQTAGSWNLTGGTNNGHITLLGIKPSDVTDLAGSSCSVGTVTLPFCSNLTFIGNDGTVYSPGGVFGSLQVGTNDVYTVNQTTPQWINIGVNGGYVAFWHSTSNVNVAELYYATNYGGGSFGVMGIWENSYGVGFEACTEITGVTAPNLGTPTGCAATFQFNGGSYPLVLSGANIYSTSKFSFAPDGGMIPTIPAGSNGLPSPTTPAGSIPYFTNVNGLLGGQYNTTNPVPLNLLQPEVVFNCGTVTTTAAASDTLSCSAVTTNSHCWATAKDAAGAGLTGVYVPAPTTPGQVIVYHSATAGGNLNVACSTN